MLDAIGHGKHVVTANKALLAAHGNEIFAAAQKAGVMVAFEAAVAGGIPIIKALREGLTANRIEWIAGIINGTSNFILSEMRATGASFDDVLAEAQKRGYAEADPTFDIEGIDAAHKLTIMSAIAFGVPMQFDKAYTEGISRLTREDIRYAEELGYRIKLLGITRRASVAGRRRHRAARASDAGSGEAPDRQRRRRDERGAGQGRRGRRRRSTTAPAPAPSRPRARSSPTWSTSRACTPPTPSIACRIWRSSPTSCPTMPFLPMGEVQTSYYLRMRVLDRPGVLADITRILADREISIDAMIQKEPPEGQDRTDIILLTHVTVEKNAIAAIAAIEALPTVSGSVVRIRLEELN